MGKQRSIFFKTLEKKKFIFPLGFCLLVLIALNTVGDDFVKNLRSKAIEQNFKIEQFMQEFYAKLTTFKYFFFCDVNKSIMELHKENIKLKCEIENLKHIKSENDELYTLLNLKKNQGSHASYEVIVAKIISVFSNDYVRSCIINVGSEDGVGADDVVRNADGFIGRICEVHENWSCVLAITDNNSKIPVKIKAQIKDQKSDGEESVKESSKKSVKESTTREPINAILNGDNSNFLRVSMKNEDSQIKEGDIAETAYLENPACNGIPVGKVIEEYGEFLIVPAVSFETIQNVCVIKNRDSSSEAKKQ